MFFEGVGELVQIQGMNLRNVKLLSRLLRIVCSEVLAVRLKLRIDIDGCGDLIELLLLCSVVGLVEVEIRG